MSFNVPLVRRDVTSSSPRALTTWHVGTDADQHALKACMGMARGLTAFDQLARRLHGSPGIHRQPNSVPGGPKGCCGLRRIQGRARHRPYHAIVHPCQNRRGLRIRRIAVVHCKLQHFPFDLKRLDRSPTRTGALAILAYFPCGVRDLRERAENQARSSGREREGLVKIYHESENALGILSFNLSGAGSKLWQPLLHGLCPALS